MTADPSVYISQTNIGSCGNHIYNYSFKENQNKESQPSPTKTEITAQKIHDRRVSNIGIYWTVCIEEKTIKKTRGIS